MNKSAGRKTSAAAVILAALAVRVGFLLAAPAPQIAGDARQYHAYAVNLLSTGDYVGADGELAARTPGYPLFLAAVYAVAGPSPRAACLAQALVGTLTCLLLYALATRILEAPWPLLCGLAAAGYGDLFSPTASVLSECIYSFALTAALTALYWDTWPFGRRALAFGFGMGATYLVRPEALFFGAAIAFILPHALRGFERRHAALALVGLGAAAALWTGRNFAVLGRFVPSSTSGGYILYQGLRLPLERDPDFAFTALTLPVTVPELERDLRYSEAFRDLRASAGVGRVVKAYAFNVLSLFYPFLPQYDATYVFLVPFWLVGLAAALRNREFWPIGLPVLVSTAIFSFAGGPVSRYRFGFSPALIVLAALGLKTLWERRGWAVPRAAGLWAGVNAAVWFWAPSVRELALRVRGILWE